MCSVSILILPLHAQKNMRKLLISLLFLVFFAPLVQAQKSGDLGLLGGVTYYMGDLNPGKPFLLSKPAFGILYRQNFNSRISLRVHGLRGSVLGDDAVSKANVERNLNFESNLTEAGLQLEINFFEYFIGSRLHSVSPYIFGGGSVFFFKPFGNLPSGKVELQPLTTENQSKQYNLYAFAGSFGLGVKYSLSKMIGVGAEWGMRKTTTDYLDDVSTTYYLNQGAPDFVLPQDVTPEMAMASDPTQNHNAGMQRGNSRDTDWYSFAGISITVKIKMLGKENCLDHQREGY